MSNPSLGPSRAAELPAEPNLEHLKKAAKLRLKAMRTAAPSTKLTDVQFQIAREYGFASWRALKVEVDRRGPRAMRSRSPRRPGRQIYRSSSMRARSAW